MSKEVQAYYEICRKIGTHLQKRFEKAGVKHKEKNFYKEENESEQSGERPL